MQSRITLDGNKEDQKPAGEATLLPITRYISKKTIFEILSYFYKSCSYFYRSSCTCPNYKFWLCLFATIFLLSCIGVASFIIYYFLQSSENPTTKIADGRYVETHHDWSVHDSWDSSNDPGANGEVAWRKSGGIWSKSKPPGGREVVVKIKGQFIPGEQEVPEGELSEGHSPM